MTALEQVERLLEQMHDAIKDPKRFEQASDALHTLVSAHMLPTVAESTCGVRLTGNERKLMVYLEARMGKAVTKQAIYSALYFDRSEDKEPGMKVVDVFVCKIRHKMTAANSPYEIQTIWGEGYRLINKSEQAKAA